MFVTAIVREREGAGGQRTGGDELAETGQADPGKRAVPGVREFFAVGAGGEDEHEFVVLALPDRGARIASSRDGYRGELDVDPNPGHAGGVPEIAPEPVTHVDHRAHAGSERIAQSVRHGEARREIEMSPETGHGVPRAANGAGHINAVAWARIAAKRERRRRRTLAGHNRDARDQRRVGGGADVFALIDRDQRHAPSFGGLTDSIEETRAPISRDS